MNKKKIRLDNLDKLRIALLCAFVAVITLLAWQSDDAYHGYVMAKHLAQGEGFVYNAGQRSSATTGPIYTLIVAVFYCITHEMFFTSLFINIVFSALAFAILIFCFCKSREQVIMAFAALVGSTSFVSYTTSGLENCLLFFLAMLFLKIYYGHQKFETRSMLALALIFAFLATARMDAVLYLIPAIVYVYLMKSKAVSFPGAVGLTFLGLLLYFLWEIFSLLYFGFHVV